MFIKDIIKIPSNEFKILFFYCHFDKDLQKTKTLLEFHPEEIEEVIQKYHRHVRIKLELYELQKKFTKALFDFWKECKPFK